MEMRAKKFLAGTLVLGAMFGVSPVAANANGDTDYIFDWTFRLGTDTPHEGTIPVPRLGNDMGADLAAFLADQESAAVKVVRDLDDAKAAEFFDGATPIQAVLADLRRSFCEFSHQ